MNMNLTPEFIGGHEIGGATSRSPNVRERPMRIASDIPVQQTAQSIPGAVRQAAMW
jgi:hypothetical protein